MTYLPRISDEAMTAPLRRDGAVLLDARVQHLGQLLLLEGSSHLRAKSLDEQRPIAFEVGADDVARPWHVDIDAVQQPARPGREDDDAIGQIHGFIDVMGHEHDRLARALPDVEEE